MLEHAVKLVWNRRRATRLVVIEIAAAFVVTFVLTALAVNFWSNYREPTGFEYQNIWQIETVNTNAAGGLLNMRTTDELAGLHEDLLQALLALPPAEAVAPIWVAPYTGGRWTQGYGGENGFEISSRSNYIGDGGLEAMNVRLASGRLFGPEDDGQDYGAVVVNRAFVDVAFPPGTDAVGRNIADPSPDAQIFDEGGDTEGLELRIVGVIEEFKQDGEFSASMPYVINRFNPLEIQEQGFTLLIKVAPGTNAGFEEEIVDTIESVAPGWTARIVSWEQLRNRNFASVLQPLIAAATIVAFIIALVFMGLIGVLWQDVVRRTQEIGLRRALGAQAATVRRQIQLEMIVVGLFGVAIGTVIAIQFPLLEFLERIDWASGLAAIALSAAFVMGLVTLGALYPSWLAARREPADALRYE